jgi:hypothetical protein
MNSALKIDLETGEAVPIQVDGENGVLRYFTGDVRGKTLRQLSEDIYLRQWSACEHPATGVAIADCYNGATLKPVDLPLSPDEYQRSFGTARQIGVKL